jgi:hypothetical protein
MVINGRFERRCRYDAAIEYKPHRCHGQQLERVPNAGLGVSTKACQRSAGDASESTVIAKPWQEGLSLISNRQRRKEGTFCVQSGNLNRALFKFRITAKRATRQVGPASQSLYSRAGSESRTNPLGHWRLGRPWLADSPSRPVVVRYLGADRRRSRHGDAGVCSCAQVTAQRLAPTWWPLITTNRCAVTVRRARVRRARVRRYWSIIIQTSRLFCCLTRGVLKEPSGGIR